MLIHILISEDVLDIKFYDGFIMCKLGKSTNLMDINKIHLIISQYDASFQSIVTQVDTRERRSIFVSLFLRTHLFIGNLKLSRKCKIITNKVLNNNNYLWKSDIFRN